LNNKQFTPVIDYDGWLLIKVRSKMQDDIEIIKCKDFENKQYFCVKKGELTAHGENIKLAMEDLLYKELEERNINEVVEKIKQSRVVTRVDYRIITGACRSGTEEFCKEKGIEDFEEIKLDELLKILDDKYFGAKEFKNLFK